ncbi:hypothetical protein [Halopelagius longus]|uniref:Uncharacterized protein n=1 Tax=Halopelagius longus TaxID=1236180 RepID=A0A1H1G8G3_9EURY|nr:hypothetical protein [Halopelagius longus]RDI69797.1 hypothetical protein DWB78_16740 [Halopelagius longus]SDR09096.1 hypothetical protein SAMN05216278_3568 [Halopelagius longus]
MSDFDTTRRGALALFGSTFLAGCSELGVGRGDSGPELDRSKLRTVASGEFPDASRTFPVDISTAFVDENVARARAALDSVPDPLGSEEVPNGAIREEMAHERTSAEDALDRATAAASSYERLDAAVDAREHAANLRGAWRAIDEDLTRAAVAERASSVREDLSAFTDRREYVGSDPVRAVLVHEEFEHRVARADSELDLNSGPQRRYDADNPLAVGETAAAVERARANVAVANHVYDRFTDSLDEPRPLDNRLERAIATLGGRLSEALDDVPRETDGERPTFVERDIEDTVAGMALDDLYGEARDARNYRYEGERPAAAVIRMHRLLAGVEAFRTLRDRVADGESFPVESTGDVAAYRTAAVEAVEAARATDDYPLLTGVELPKVVARLSRADDELTPGDDGDDDAIRARWVRREIATYVAQRHVAEAIPNACRTTGDALSE